MARLTRSAKRFQDALLAIMDRKHHWAWPHFSGGGLSRAQLKIHFQQEYAVYVRDFPVLLARVHGRNPPFDVRQKLAENIFEEDTGGLSVGRSHPRLFLEMMQGLGYVAEDFERVRLLPASRAYRRWLDEVSAGPDWVVAAAVLTIFVEGSIKDRREIAAPSQPKTASEIEDTIRKHPLVQHHGVAPACMDLIRAHQLVEAGHRHDAYEIVLSHAREPRRQRRILTALDMSLRLWLRYRDGVARACRLSKPRSSP
ncbi:iron-containing redox enzyme family protein [Candidatus Nitrospira bockiana]